MLDKEKEVQGFAVYGEFRKEGATTMVLITPDGYGTDGARTGAQLFRRVLTTYSPKRQWRASYVGNAEVEGVSIPLKNEDKERYAESRLSFAVQLFEGIKNGGWAIAGKPIVTEVSRKDIDDIRAGRTPSKVIYRINQTRAKVGYPAELV
jgi:hypothetical protein